MPILSGYDTIEVNQPRFQLEHGKHSGKVKTAKLNTIKRKDGSGSFKKLAVEVESGGGVVTVDTFVPSTDAEWRDWSEGKQRMFKRALSALGLAPTDLDTDTGRMKAVGQMVEIKSKPHYQNADWTDYELVRLLSNSTDSMPSVTERLAQQFDADDSTQAGTGVDAGEGAPAATADNPFAADPVV